MPRLMRERRLGLGVIGVVMLLASLPAPVSAATPDVSDFFGLGSEAPAEFSAKASKGYSIGVEGSGGQVTLSASGPAGIAIYVVPGRISTGGILASFGKRGRVDVKFKPSRRKKVEMPPNRCKGKPHVIRWGVFAGTIRFAGERGYTRLSLHRAHGRTHVTPDWKCKRRPGDGSDKTEGTQPNIPGESSEDALILEIANRRTGVEAGAFTLRPPDEKGLTAFIAAVEERRKQMQIARFAFGTGNEQTFSFDESLSTATISPPPPFAGTAIFQRDPGGRGTLTGSLSVVLPGTARIPLVGAGYSSRLYRLSEDGIAIPAARRLSRPAVS